jgi:predicted peptidase
MPSPRCIDPSSLLMSSPAVSSPSSALLSNKLRAVTNEHGYDYLVSQPPSSEGDSPRRWPLILFLHGAGVRGANVTDLAVHGLMKLLSGGTELTAPEIDVGRDVAARFVVVAPQCAHYEVWNEAELLRLLDDVSEKFHVDPDRVYLTGLSMGGFGVWSAGMRYPQRFAALVPICGGGRITDIAASAEAQPAALRSLGVWAFHGARDRIVPLDESQRMIDALRKVGQTNVKFTVYAEGEHDAWSATYANPELYRWLLQHARTRKP